MKMTLNLPDALIAKALECSDRKIKSAVIVQALDGFVRKHRIQELKRYKGRIAFDINLDSLRNRK